MMLGNTQRIAGKDSPLGARGSDGVLKKFALHHINLILLFFPKLWR